MGCFTVPQHRKAKCRPAPPFSAYVIPHGFPAETKLSACPSPASSSCHGSWRSFDVPLSARPSPVHSSSFKLTPSRALGGASPLRKYASSHGRFEQWVDDSAVGRCPSCGYGDERLAASHSSTITLAAENEDGSRDATNLFPLPLPPSVSASSATSSSTCVDDASSSPSISSTGSASLLSVSTIRPSYSCRATATSLSNAVTSKSCSNSLSLSSTADRQPLHRWHPSALPLPPPPCGSSGMALSEFSYEELAGACLNFAPEFFIREGGAGPVFRASLKRAAPEGGDMDVAVTRLTRGRLQSFKKWRAEVGSLARLSHPHLCKVVGFSAEDSSGPPDKVPGFERERLLVYEHMSNGSLVDLLYCRKGKAPLDWGTRLKIATGAAKGLAILHDRTPRQIMYKRFGTINIQVDSSFNAKLSDYGFSSSSIEYPTSSPAPSETLYDAYAAPETHISDELSVKSNVWSFGIVLLELLTGRQNMDDFFLPEERNLVQWCRPYLLDSKRLYLIMDPELKGRYPTRMAKIVADLALLCLAEDPAARPTMRNVSGSLCRLIEGNAGQAKVDHASCKSTTTHPEGMNSMNGVRPGNWRHGIDKGARGRYDANTHSNKHGSKFKLSKSYSLVSVLASPARAFVGAGTGGGESTATRGRGQRARLRGFLSEEISMEACQSWARDHLALSGSYGFLSGDIGVEVGSSGPLRQLLYQDSYLPPPLGRSISSSSHLAAITG